MRASPQLVDADVEAAVGLPVPSHQLRLLLTARSHPSRLVLILRRYAHLVAVRLAHQVMVFPLSLELRLSQRDGLEQLSPLGG